MAEIKIDPFVELGVTGVKRTGGVITDEFINKLRGRQGALLWREMADNDPVVGALMFAIQRLILQIDWRVDPFEEGNAKKLLIGGIEEISNYNYNIDFLSLLLSLCEVI